MTLALPLSIIVRVLLAFIFLRATWHNARDLPHFRAQLQAFQLLPVALLPALAWLLVGTEAVLACTLPVWEWRLPPFLAGGLLALYTAALAINLWRGREDIDCGCGGASAQAISWALVVRNTFLILLSLIAMLPVASRDISLLELGTVVPAGITVILVYCSVELAIANEQRQRRALALRRGMTS